MSSKSASHRQKQQHKSNASTKPSTPYQKAAPVVVKKQHGGWLTAAIILMAAHGIFNIIAVLSYRKVEYTNIPPWLFVAVAFVGLATLVSAGALWYWRRWGLYLYVVATFVSLALGVIAMRSMIAAFYNIIPLAVLGWILNSQRKMQLLV